MNLLRIGDQAPDFKVKGICATRSPSIRYR